MTRNTIGQWSNNLQCFTPGYAIEIHAMTYDEIGKRTAQRGEKIVEYSVLAKEYLPSGEIKIHFDEDFPDFEAADAAAVEWEQKWGISTEHIGG